MRISKLVAVGLAGALFVAACGDDDDASSDATTDDATTDDGATTAPPDEGTTAPPDEGTTAPAPTTGGGSATTTGSGGDAATLRVWLNGPDTPDAMIDLAKAEFAKTHPDVTIEVERQQWDGLVDRLATVLPTDDSPDIFEVGNTQAQAFEAAGAMVDLTDAKEADRWRRPPRQPRRVGHVRRVGSTACRLRRCAHRGLPQGPVREVEPRDPDDDGRVRRRRQEAQEDNADVANFSGIYFPGRNWQAMLSFIWDAGGDIAIKEGEEWVGMLDSPESVAGLGDGAGHHGQCQRRRRPIPTTQRLPRLLQR